MKDDAAVHECREKRLRMAALRECADMRGRFGEHLVRAINVATPNVLRLDDFQPRPRALPIEWPADIHDAPGLVCAYVAEADAISTMSRIERKLGPLDGDIGFHEKDYLGFAAVTGFAVSSMVAIAASTMDSVVFCSEGAGIVLLVDCYQSGFEEPFSVAIQGSDVPEGLRECDMDGRAAG